MPNHTPQSSSVTSRRRPYVLAALSFPLFTVAMATIAVPAWAAGDKVLGKTVYEKNCLGCHGKAGTGLGGATPSLIDRGKMASKTDTELFDVVSNGRPGTGMPAWGKVLSESDRWNVVAYLQSLAGR